MAKVLLGVTGSVAALKTPELVAALRHAGHDVKVIATQPALYFFHREQLPGGVLHTDEDEWPGRRDGAIWQRTDPVLHIELRRWADLFVIAPLDANTLAKLAAGLCDNCLTCVWRAWDLSRPVLLAPAMNTLMWDHPHTARHLHSLAQVFGLKLKDHANPFDVLNSINEQSKSTLWFVGPIEKALACGDIGLGAMSEVNDIVNAVTRFSSRT